MKKNESSKIKDWGKLNVQAEQVTPAATSVDEADTTTTKKPEPAASQLTHPSYEVLEEQLLKTETLLEEHKSKVIQYEQQVIYHAAEMQNLRRRSELDIKSVREFSLESFVKNLLPVKDYLETALDVINSTLENSSILKGVQLTLQEFQKVLDRNGVKAIEPALGEVFNAHYHQAMLAEENNHQSPLLHQDLLHDAGPS